MLRIVKPAQEAAQRGLSRKPGNSNKSQAVSELAIFGTLIILGFAALLSYIQSFNSQQALQMQAFRKAYQLSRQLNKEVSYTIIKDTPLVDVGDLFGRPDINRMTASSTVVAMTKDPAPKNETERDSVEYYEVNGQLQEIRPIKINLRYQSGNRDMWIAAPVSDVEYASLKHRTGTLSKSEDAVSITTTRQAQVRTDTTTDLILEDQAIFEENYLKDAQDNVEIEPWQKEIKTHHTLYNFKTWLELNFLGDAAIVLGSLGYSCGISGELAEGMIISSYVLLAEELTSYLLSADSTENEVVLGVSVTQGYRPKESLNSSKTFNLPEQPFAVSH